MTDDPASARPLRILVVDDHEIVRQGLVALLDRREGFEVVAQAGTVAEAVAEARRFAPDLVGKRLNPAHSLSDAYLAADLVTDPSLYEGFGNALVEALFYGTPVMVNRYSVYDADIRPLGLRMIEIDGAITDATVADVRDVLADPERRASDARHNFRIGREHLGYDVLRRSLAELLA